MLLFSSMSRVSIPGGLVKDNNKTIRINILNSGKMHF